MGQQAQPVGGETTTGHAAAVDTVAQRVMAQHRIPAMSVAVVGRERVHLLQGYGWADLARREPASAWTAYPWFSMTKIVTATAAMRLAAEGRLDLEAPFDEYVPGLPARAARGATVRQLLTHTAGLRNPLPVRWAHSADVEGPSPRALLDRLLASRRPYRPRDGRARYSNVGYLALGEVIATASGTSFPSYVREAVLQPAGMHRTGFTYAGHASVATGYVRAPRGTGAALRLLLPAGVAGPRHGAHLALDRFYVDGPAYGGLIGDVQDVARLIRLHLNDGAMDGRRVLPAESARSMRTVAHPGTPFDHGIGWFRQHVDGSHEWVEHLGSGAGFWNVMRLYPRRGIGVVVMASTTTRYDVEPLLRTAVDHPWA